MQRTNRLFVAVGQSLQGDALVAVGQGAGARVHVGLIRVCRALSDVVMNWPPQTVRGRATIRFIAALRVIRSF